MRRLEPYTTDDARCVESFAELVEQDTGERPLEVEVHSRGGHMDVYVSERTHPARRFGHVLVESEVDPDCWRRLTRAAGLIP